jgi:transcriptional regulator with XRE-family HTH domain
MPYDCHIFADSETHGCRGRDRSIPLNLHTYGGQANNGDDMNINRTLILGLRKQRSWSQDELAVSSGLNLRTVQRIERSGMASLQSRKALAAAFNVDVSDLDFEEEAVKTKYEYRVIRFDTKWKAMGMKLAEDFIEMEKQLNVLGADGWELVKLSEIFGGGTGTVALVATLKRTAE